MNRDRPPTELISDDALIGLTFHQAMGRAFADGLVIRIVRIDGEPIAHRDRENLLRRINVAVEKDVVTEIVGRG